MQKEKFWSRNRKIVATINLLIAALIAIAYFKWFDGIVFALIDGCGAPSADCPVFKFYAYVFSPLIAALIFSLFSQLAVKRFPFISYILATFPAILTLLLLGSIYLPALF